MGDSALPKERLDDLTRKQREVLDLLLEHKTSKEIARELHISPHTVDQRIDFAKKKLGVSSRGDLALRYRELISIYEPLTYEDSLMVRPGIAADTSGQDETAYYLLQPAPKSTQNGSSAEPVEEYRIVPAMFDGPYRTWVRLGAIIGIALGMMLLVLGGMAIFGELSSLLSS